MSATSHGKIVEHEGHRLGARPVRSADGRFGVRVAQALRDPGLGEAGRDGRRDRCRHLAADGALGASNHQQTDRVGLVDPDENPSGMTIAPSRSPSSTAASAAARSSTTSKRTGLVSSAVAGGGSSSPEVSVPDSADPSASTTPIVNEGEVAPPTRTLKTTAKASGPAKAVMRAERLRNRRRRSVVATSRAARLERDRVARIAGAGPVVMTCPVAPCPSGAGTRPRGRVPAPRHRRGRSRCGP